MTSKFSSFEEFAGYLDGLGLFHMDLGLGRIRGALNAMNLSRPPWIGVQVVGTNGKGSTSTMLARLFSEHGLKTGLFTSPHFLSIRERILINGAQLPEADWLDAANAVFAAYNPPENERLTYFELLTAMAARIFADKGVKAAVFETGLGGRHDAVTALAHDLILFTPIGEDHMQVLGDTALKIARDKAGAMRQGVPAITGRQREDVLDALRSETAAGNLLLQDRFLIEFAPEIGLARPRRDAPGPVIEDIIIGMRGAYQEQNAHLALAALYFLAEHRGFNVDPESVRKALAAAFIPGRMQRVRLPGFGPEIILDCAHNLPAMLALKETFEREIMEPSAIIFACLRDKDIGELAPRLLAMTPGPILVPEISVPQRAVPAAKTAAVIGERAAAVKNVAEAMDRLADQPGPILICGSIYLLAAFYEQYPQTLDRTRDD